MINVEMTTNGDILTITVDLSKSSGMSKSGKTVTIASTQGNKTIHGTNAVIGLNIYRYPDK